MKLAGFLLAVLVALQFREAVLTALVIGLLSGMAWAKSKGD